MLYRVARSILRVIFFILFHPKVEGRSNIPKQGAVILCCNHISYLDPPFIGTPLPRKVRYMAKAELFRVPVLGWLITRFGAFPVKRGGVSKESIRIATQLLQTGQVLGIFPEGTRNNTEGSAKKGAASLALRTQATVIPVAIIGTYTPFRRMSIVYGEPLDLSEFAEEVTSERLERATDKIMSAIRGMMKHHGNKQVG